MSASPAPVAVLTLAAGRHRHLRRQVDGLRTGRHPDLQVVASMGDPEIAGVLADEAPPWPVVVVDVPVGAAGELPLAAARNAAAAAALARGSRLLVLLDVDCIPGPTTLDRYAVAAAELDSDTLDTAPPVLLCGPVRYLPALDPGEEYDLTTLDDVGRRHPARPEPPPGDLEQADDLRLFWSLSFATTARSWRAAGGFDEAYVGYGGEDTDFAMRVGARGGSMWWVGGATAHHQHHPTESPPVRHLEAVVRNAGVFHRRWGWYPMEGWLAEFERSGLAHRDGVSGAWLTGLADPAKGR